MTKMTFFIFSFLLSQLAIGQSLKEDSLVYWNERELEWKDFNVKNGQLDEIMGEATAYCAVLASTFYEDSCLNYEVYSVFNRNQSWVSGIKSLELLNHEQLHFDIVELYSRKIRKSIAEKIALGYKREDVDIDIRALINQIPMIQVDYDNETLNGQDAYFQEKWLSKIKDSLNQYDSFSAPTGKVCYPE